MGRSSQRSASAFLFLCQNGVNGEVWRGDSKFQWEILENTPRHDRYVSFTNTTASHQLALGSIRAQSLEIWMLIHVDVDFLPDSQQGCCSQVRLYQLNMATKFQRILLSLMFLDVLISAELPACSDSAVMQRYNLSSVAFYRQR